MISLCFIVARFVRTFVSVAVVAVAVAFVLIGCSAHYVSLPCEIAPTPRPKDSGELLTNLKNLLIYTESLEADLAFCRGKR